MSEAADIGARRPGRRTRRGRSARTGWWPRPSRECRAAAGGVLSAVALAVAGCSSAGPSAGRPATGTEAAGGAGISLATSMATPQDSWALLPVSSDPVFWQVFVRPAGSSSWRLDTPPGVADNGGLVASAGGDGSLTVAVRPSDKLLFSPLASTSDGGRSWSAGGPLGSAVAASPDALAAYGGKLVALLGDGAIETSSDAGTTWSMLAAPGAIAASAAGRGCGGAIRVTAISFGMPGAQVLAGGSCGTSGTAVFSYSPGAGWQRLGKPAGGELVRLSAGMALVRSTSGLSAMWYGYGWYAYAPLATPSPAGTPAGWRASAALPASGRIIASGTLLGGSGPSASPGAWVLLSGGRAATVSGPADAAGGTAQWTQLPRVPAGTSVLASGPGGALDALAVSGTTVTVWRLPFKGTAWSRVQATSVPIQAGSSG